MTSTQSPCPRELSPRRTLRLSTWFAVAFAVVMLVTPPASARDFYVDNLLGDDRMDGTASRPQGDRIGPTRSINRALQYVKQGDTLHIENRGVPYFESITLEGRRHSGWEKMPFRVVSNGAVLSGARRVPPVAWVPVGGGVWKFTPDGKGYFLLLKGGRAVPEFGPLTTVEGLGPLPVGQWSALRGSIYLRLNEATAESPAETDYEFAYDATGITLIDVHDVRVEGLIVRNFRIDGIHAHDRVQRVYLEQVRLERNGRSGLAVSGTSEVGLTAAELTGNRRAAITLREHGWLETMSVTIDAGDAEPYDRGPGTTLFVDGEELPSEMN